MKHETSRLEKRLLFVKFLLDFRCNKTLGFALDDVQRRVHIQLDKNVGDTPPGAAYLVKAKRLSFNPASQSVAKEMVEQVKGGGLVAAFAVNHTSRKLNWNTGG